MGFTINTTTIWNMVHRVGFFETQVFETRSGSVKMYNGSYSVGSLKKASLNHQDLCNRNVTQTECFGNGVFQNAQDDG